MDIGRSAQFSRRTRRDRRSERNRQRLIVAVLELLQEQPLESLTMAGVCERAGCYHSAFYAHFDNVQACVAAAVRDGFERRLVRDIARWERLYAERLEDGASQRALLADTLRGVLEGRALYQVVARSRNVPGPLGALERELRERQIDMVTELTWKLALDAGVGADHLRDIEAAARYNVESYWRVAVDLVQGVPLDIEREAERLYRFGRHVITGEIRRALRARSSRNQAS